MKIMKKLKGFTLIELIIVMALLVSVLTAILQLMQPVNEAFSDSTVYDEQRTVEDGIISYICETTRYAKNISIIDKGVSLKNSDGTSYSGYGGSSDLSSAVTYFKEINSLTSADDSKIQIIVIDRHTEFQNGANSYKGRLIRMKGWDSSYASWSSPVSNTVVSTSSAWQTKARYMALGPAFYGKNSYDITLPNDIDGSGNPVNQLPRGFDIQVSPKTAKKSVDTLMKGSVTNMNYTIAPTTIDYQTFDAPGIAGTNSREDNDTYIIFINPS